MYDEFIPPPPPDVIRDGLPNLRHGRVHQHPLEEKLRKTIGDRLEAEYDQAASLFGLGFAQHLRTERQIIMQSQQTTPSAFEMPNLGMELSTGDIDELDFCDLFDAVPWLPVDYDPHAVREKLMTFE
jgi:hypothetical protein